LSPFIAQADPVRHQRRKGKVKITASETPASSTQNDPSQGAKKFRAYFLK
jgi:hypothetical protein